MTSDRPAIIVYGTTWCPDCRRSKQLTVSNTKQAVAAAGGDATAALMIREYLHGQ
jgi:glutaredoxin